MSIAIPVVLLIGSYLIGNINPAILIGRSRGIDVRSEGSGNAGTTNAMRSMGRKVGIAVFLIDAAKGFLPALFFPGLLVDAFAASHGIDANEAGTVFTLVLPEATRQLALIFGLCVIVGHMWPALFRFRGGKGVATTFGVLLAVNPVMALILIGIVLALAAATRIMSLSVIVACAAAVPLSLLMGSASAAPSGPPVPALLACILAFVIFKHRENIIRLARGEEKKITFGSKEKNND